MFIAFSDSENELEFEPKTTNTAVSVRLSSGSTIIGGLKSRQELLIWTDTSLYSMQFIGPPLTFSINLINEVQVYLARNRQSTDRTECFSRVKIVFIYTQDQCKNCLAPCKSTFLMI